MVQPRSGGVTYPCGEAPGKQAPSAFESHVVARDLKKIYQAATVIEAEQALESFVQAWDAKYLTIAKMWRTKWTMPIHHWKQALNHFAILYEDRMPKPIHN